MHRPSLTSMKKFILSIIVLTNLLTAQPVLRTLTGIVRDAAGNPLPYATVRIDGTGVGTICDGEGRFELRLPGEARSITFSYVGFLSRSVSIPLEKEIIVRLQQSSVELSEVVVSGEDPAVPIVRAAMETKKKRQRTMEEFTAKVYVKESLGRDSLKSTVSEAYARVRFRAPDSLSEQIVWRRQANAIKTEFQLAQMRERIDFYDDTIQYIGHAFVGPLADDAFSYYDYHLARTSVIDGQTMYEIELTPRTELRPLFRGTMTISDSGYLLRSVRFAPNAAFQYPMLRIDTALIVQQYTAYEGRHWMPLEYHVMAVLRFRLAGFAMGFAARYEKSVINFEYDFTPHPDEPVLTPPVALPPQASHVDLNDNGGFPVVFPLSDIEKMSYERMDAIAEQSPFLNNFGEYLYTVQYWLRPVELRYNRVEGLFLGGKGSLAVWGGLTPFVSIGYGTADRTVKYRVGPEWRSDEAGSFAVGTEFRYDIETMPFNERVDPVGNGVWAFFNGEDLVDYTLVHGRRAYASAKVLAGSTVELSYHDDRYLSAYKNTDVSLAAIGTTFHFRPNPPVQEGRYRSVVLDLFRRPAMDTTFFAVPKNEWQLRYERGTDPSGTPFTSLYADLIVRINTMGSSRLFNPYLGVTATAGRLTGAPPAHRMFTVEGTLRRFMFPSSFRTMTLRQYSGDRFVAVTVEHNFRNIPFGLIGLPGVPMDLILRAGYAEVSAGHVTTVPVFYERPVRRYWEYTFGIGRIFDLLRLDLTYTKVPAPRYVITTALGL